MSDGTSSEASYSYESESQHWEFGDYDYLDGDDDQVKAEDAQVEGNRQPFALSGARSSSQGVRDDQQLVTDQDRDGEGGPRQQDGIEVVELRASGSGRRLRLRTDDEGEALQPRAESRAEREGGPRAEHEGRPRAEREGSARAEQTAIPRAEPRADHEERQTGGGDSENDTGDDMDPRAEQAGRNDGADADEDDNHVRQHSTVIHLNGYQYTRARQSRVRIAYRCSFYRRTGCKGKVQYEFASAAYINFVAHTRRATVVAPAAVVDVSTRMEAETDRLAMTNQGMTAQQIWESVSQQFYQRDDGMVVRGLTRLQMMGRVHRTRRMHFGGNVHGVIEVPPLALVARADLTFFQFHHIYHEAGQLQRIIGWAHPRLLELLRYPGIQLFVDGTFRSVPRSFHQCVVVMVRDAASRVVIPVVYVLTTNRIIPTYNRLFRFVADAAGQPLRPAQIAVDFEQALIDAVGENFPTARVIGCLFQWNQAIRRRMIALHLPVREIGIAMEVGVLDMLTVVPPADVAPLGLQFVERTIRRRCREEGISYSTRHWAQFWAYFRRTWLTLFPVDVWNVHGMDLQVVSRTNNPLERFNRELNAAIAAPHPSLPAFVGMIDGLSQRYVRLLNDITNRRAVPPQQGVVQLPVPVPLTRQGAQRRQARRGRRQTRPARTSSTRTNGATRRTRRTT